MYLIETNHRHLQLERLGARLRRRLAELHQDPRRGAAPAMQLLSAELIEIDHALGLLHRGLGDRCECCGETIEAKLLQALPYTCRCGSCRRAAAS